MKRSTAILAGAGLALSTIISFTGIAIAQDQDPEITCAEAIEIRIGVQAELDRERSELTELEARLAGLPRTGEGLGVLVFTQVEIDRLLGIDEEDSNFVLAQAKLAIIRPVVAAQNAVNEQRRVVAAVQVRLEAAIDTVDRECEQNEPPAEPPIVGDLDCNDFPLADGRTALDVLRETPDVDEHNLDNNRNGIPCEVPDTRDNDNVVPDTSNGVATGLA